MTTAIADVFTRVGATGFLHAREIGTDGDDEVSVRSDEPVILASVFKTFVLVAFVRAVDAGRLDPSERTTVTARYRTGGVGTAGFADDVEASWRDLAHNMMVMSDNAATDVLYHQLGREAVDQVVSDLGLSQTRLIGCCEDLFASVVEDLGGGSESNLEELLGAATTEPLLLRSSLPPPSTSSAWPPGARMSRQSACPTSIASTYSFGSSRAPIAGKQ